MSSLFNSIHSNDFIEEFSYHAEPSLPTELRFWLTMTQDQKEEFLKKRRNDGKKTPFAEGVGQGYISALSIVRSKNERNEYWLPIMLEEMKQEADEVGAKRVIRCLSTYKNLEVSS